MFELKHIKQDVEHGNSPRVEEVIRITTTIQKKRKEIF
jgi:hypothetical protein